MYALNGEIPNEHVAEICRSAGIRKNATGEKTAVKARIYDKTNSNVKSRIIRLEFRVILPR